MNKREFIIIIGAACIGIYGLLDYFIISGDTMNSNEEAINSEMEQIDTYTTQVLGRLAVINSSNNFNDMNYLISKAETPWNSDPFMKYNISENEFNDSLGEEEGIALLYTGFIKAGRKTLAVINGMEYKVGELLKEVTYKVSKITPSKVILLTEANKEIILKLKEN